MPRYLDENKIPCFTPDDTDAKFYVLADNQISLAEIIDRAENKFGVHISFSDIIIEAEHIHTRCLGLDYYDFQDYDDYLVVSLKEGAAD